VWYIVAFYVIAMGLLGFHLYHGAWSLFQSLGYDTPERNRGLRLFAAASAVIVFLGFCSVPVLFILGAMPEPPPAATARADQPAGGP
jgi:succinate dehydrogenase / fumarate reductase cytochrome b subunit